MDSVLGLDRTMETGMEGTLLYCILDSGLVCRVWKTPPIKTSNHVGTKCFINSFSVIIDKKSKAPDRKKKEKITLDLFRISLILVAEMTRVNEAAESCRRDMW